MRSRYLIQLLDKPGAAHSIYGKIDFDLSLWWTGCRFAGGLRDGNRRFFPGVGFSLLASGRCLGRWDLELR